MIGREAIASEVRRARYTATATRRPVYASTCWPDKTTRISAVSTSMTWVSPAYLFSLSSFVVLPVGQPNDILPDRDMHYDWVQHTHMPWEWKKERTEKDLKSKTRKESGKYLFKDGGLAWTDDRFCPSGRCATPGGRSVLVVSLLFILSRVCVCVCVRVFTICWIGKRLHYKWGPLSCII